MGGSNNIRTNGLSGTSNSKHDGTGTLLLDPSAQQNYNDAPFQCLIRPQPSSPAVPSNSGSKSPLLGWIQRRWHRNWRIALAVGAAIVVVLILWFLFLSSILSSNRIRSGISLEKGLEPIGKDETSSTRKEDVYVSAIHNLPSIPFPSVEVDKEEKVTTKSMIMDFEEDDVESVGTGAVDKVDGVEQDDDESIEVDRIELPLNASSSIVVSKIKAAVERMQPQPKQPQNTTTITFDGTKPKGKGPIVLPVDTKNGTKSGTSQVSKIITTTPDKTRPMQKTQTTTTTSSTTASTETKATTTSTTTTTTTTPSPPVETSSSSEPEDDDDGDLFWMRHRKPSSVHPSSNQQEQQRPTIKLDPVEAIHSAYRGRQRQQELESRRQQHPAVVVRPWPSETVGKAGNEQQNPPDEKMGVVDELSKIIDDLDGSVEEKDDGKYQKPIVQGNDKKQPVILKPNRTSEKTSSYPHIDNIFPPAFSFPAEGGGHRADDDIKPVVIPFEFDIKSSEFPLPKKPQPAHPPLPIEPVWRRKPPKEEAKEKGKDNETTPKIGPFSYHPDQMPLLPEDHDLSRKRRQASIIVTALLDIGRGDWLRFTRHFDQYLEYLKNMLLSLDNNIIIYCERSVIQYLVKMGPVVDWRRIQIVEIGLMDLPFFRWREEIADIIEREQENWPVDRWDPRMKSHPEALYPDYDIVVNSKSYFMYNASQISRFGNGTGSDPQFFVWVDAGFGHGSKTVFPKEVWTPKFPQGRITVVQLNAHERVEKFTIDMVYRKQKSVVSGGVLAGDPVAIKRFHVFFMKIFMDLLDSGRVDDDQTTLLMTIAEYRSTFHLVPGGWFDAFKLFPSQKQS